MRILVSLACLCALAACAAAPGDAPIRSEHRFGESFSTGGPMENVGGEIGVAFLGVVEDSRCPKRVTCIWQGAATVKVAVQFDTDPDRSRQELLLTTYPEGARTTSVRGYRIELLDVAPYPEEADAIDRRDYSVTLRVTRGQ